MLHLLRVDAAEASRGPPRTPVSRLDAANARSEPGSSADGEDDPRAGRPGQRPGLVTVGQREYAVVDRDHAAGGQGQHRGQGLGPLLGGDRVVGVAEDAQARPRRAAEENSAESEAEPPRLTSRPPGPRASAAAAAARRRRGRSPHPPGRPPRRPVGRSARPAPRRDPARPPRARPLAGPATAASERTTATTRRGAELPGHGEATWPTTPLAPSTTTRSPDRSPARQVRAIQAAMPEVPIAATAASGTSGADRDQVGVRHCAPLGQAAVPGAIPAPVANHTRVPTA